MARESQDRTAIVTGGARGIGAGISRRLAADGFAVAVLDLDEARAKATAKSIVADGGRAVGIAVDVADAESVSAAVDRIVAELGEPTVLVNNAGITRDNLLFKLTEDDWDTVMAVNLRGPFLMSRAVQKYMTAAKWGRIVNISSISALGNRGQANYAASKAGIQGFTKTLALELGKFGVTVNAIGPGFVDTEMTRGIAERTGFRSTTSRPPTRRTSPSAASASRRTSPPSCRSSRATTPVGCPARSSTADRWPQGLIPGMSECGVGLCLLTRTTIAVLGDRPALGSSAAVSRLPGGRDARRPRARPRHTRRRRGVPGREPAQRAGVAGGAGRPALRRAAGRERPRARRAQRGLRRPGRRRRAQADGPLRALARRRRRHDGAAAVGARFTVGVPRRGRLVTGVRPRAPRKVLFGPGRAAELAALLPTLGSRVLLCTGSDPSRHRHLLGDVEPVAVVPVTARAAGGRRAAGARRRRGRPGADVVVAIGGGSVLDLAKAVAVLLGNGTDPLDHLEVVGRGLPIERPSAALRRGAHHRRHRRRGDRERGAGLRRSTAARRASAARTCSRPSRSSIRCSRWRCPPAVTASSGLDALTQCLEPYVSPKANPATDAVAAEGLRRGRRSLRRAYEHGDDRAAREDMALCSLFGGISLANAKLGAVHGVAGVVGGMVDAPHGAVCAALLAPVVEANVRALRERDPDSPALDRYAAVARLLTGRDDATVDDAVAWLRETVAALDVRRWARSGCSRRSTPRSPRSPRGRAACRATRWPLTGGRARRGARRRGRRVTRGRHARDVTGGRAPAPAITVWCPTVTRRPPTARPASQMVACPLAVVVVSSARGVRRLGGPGCDDRTRGRASVARRTDHRCLHLGHADAEGRRRRPVAVLVARGHRAGPAGRVGEQRHRPDELRVEHQGVDRGRLPAGGAGRGPGRHGQRARRHRGDGAQQRQRGRAAALRGDRWRRDPAAPALGLRRDRRDLDPGILVAHPDHRRGRHPDLHVRPAQRAGLPGGDDLLTDLRSVDPDDAFGIKAALPPTTTVSMKNGWMPHSSTTGEWNVNCVAAWDDYVLAVLTRYPVDRPLAYGADVCRDVTAALVERLR